MPDGPLRQTPRGLMLHVKATPKARHAEIGRSVTLPDGTTALAVKVTAVPEDGKANAAIIELLAKASRLPKSTFTLVAGETSRHKIFRVSANEDAITRWLAELAGQV